MTHAVRVKKIIKVNETPEDEGPPAFPVVCMRDGSGSSFGG